MNTPKNQYHEQKVSLAFNDVSYSFDDQYSLLLWGRMSAVEFSSYMKEINDCMATVAIDQSYLGIARGIVLTFLALNFFILPGVLAATVKPGNTSMVILASAGVIGVIFFCLTLVFVCLYHKIETKASKQIKGLLSKFNKVCHPRGLNWRLVDSQLIEFESESEATSNEQGFSLQRRRHLPRQWIEIEITPSSIQYEYNSQLPTLRPIVVCTRDPYSMYNEGKDSVQLDVF